MSPSQYAKVRGVSTETVRRWIREGKLHAARINGKYDIPSTPHDTTQTPQNNDTEMLLAEFRTQLQEKDKQIEELHQILALAQKNVADLTQQLSTQARLLEDKRNSHWWQRFKTRLLWREACH